MQADVNLLDGNQRTTQVTAKYHTGRIWGAFYLGQGLFWHMDLRGGRLWGGGEVVPSGPNVGPSNDLFLSPSQDPFCLPDEIFQKMFLRMVKIKPQNKRRKRGSPPYKILLIRSLVYEEALAWGVLLRNHRSIIIHHHNHHHFDSHRMFGQFAVERCYLFPNLRLVNPTLPWSIARTTSSHLSLFGYWSNDMKRLSSLWKPKSSAVQLPYRTSVQCNTWCNSKILVSLPV